MITETTDRLEKIQDGGKSAVMQIPDDNFIDRNADMTPPGQTRKEARWLTDSLANPKVTRKIGTWNVRTMFSIGKTAQTVREMRKYHLDILGVSECRWTGSGKTKTSTGETILYSGREDGHHSSGVAIILTKEVTRTLEEWTPVSDRIITARFWSKHIKTTLIQVYAPTNEADNSTKEIFYEQLQSVLSQTPRHDTIIVIGDLNAKIGAKLDGENGTVGNHGLRSERSDNGERFVSFCANNNMAIVSTMFPHKKIHLQTWASPNGQHHNQIDHVAVNGRFRSSVTDVRVYRGADVGTDHHLVIVKTKLKLHKVGKKPSISKRYETCKLKVPEIKQQFKLEIRNRFSVLEDDSGNDLEKKWEEFKSIYNDTALNILGPRTKENQEWISNNSWKEVEKRKLLKAQISGTKSARVKKRLRDEYSSTDKNVKRSMRRDRRQWLDKLAEEAETSARCGNMKGVYDITKRLCNDKPKQVDNVKDKNGKLLTKENDVKTRWKEHFQEVLNRPEPAHPAEIDTDLEEAQKLEIDTAAPTKEEIRHVLKGMKNGKSPGIDNITGELLRADMETATDQIHKITSMVWSKEQTPDDWRKGLIIKLAKKGDLTICGNWRGITLIPNVTKIMGKIIISRIAKEVDRHLRDEQAGFRAGRGTTEQIFILRNVLEQCAEWNANLYMLFIDFEKAFDSVHRETLWNIMRHYGIPDKLVRMVKCLYAQSECAVIDRAGTTEWFPIKSGVKQGCNMSGFLFLLVIDWIMRKATPNNTTGIRWNFTEKLEDLDYADDIALLSSTKDQIQRKCNLLNIYAKATGLKINAAKTKSMRMNTNHAQLIEVDGTAVDDVEQFVYLGATVTHTGGTSEDIRKRLGHARVAYHRLKAIWSSSQIGKSTKFRLFKSNVISVLLYGSETWRMTKGDEKLLDTFLHKCIRTILKIYWPQRISNEEARERAGLDRISDTIRKKRWKWIGHVLRMEGNQNVRIALDWTPEGKRRRGRPRETWRRTVEKERHSLGFDSWAAAKRSAQDRNGWRELVCGPILHRERGK